jgi:predicted RNase H-like HicB family nuclease
MDTDAKEGRGSSPRRSTHFQKGTFQRREKVLKSMSSRDNEVTVTFKVEIEQEEDGRWIAEVLDLPGVLAYGQTPEEARAKVQALAFRVVADRLE